MTKKHPGGRPTDYNDAILKKALDYVMGAYASEQKDDPDRRWTLRSTLKSHTRRFTIGPSRNPSESFLTL